MDRKGYLKDLGELVSRLSSNASSLKVKIAQWGGHINLANKVIKDTEFIKKVYEGLNLPSDQKNPGKCSYNPTYYFVSKINLEDLDIIESNEPSLYQTCGTCGNKHPVLMSLYQKTSDVPDNVRWHKKAFYICGNEIHELAFFDRASLRGFKF
jgi:hypothetical protein